MSLGAIDFGMVVDGSVVMVENMVHRLQKAGAGRPRLAVMREAAHEVARPIFFGVLIILMVYVPIATLRGMEGLLYRPMAITVATAVFGSLILAFVYVPAIAAITFRKGVKLRRNFVMDWLRPRYQGFLERFLDRRLPILGSALAVFGASMAVVPLLGTEFLPELDEGSILVEQVRMPSVTLEESMENANWFAGELLRNIEEIETVVPKTGRSDLANDWMGVHQTDVWVMLKPMEAWREGMTKERIVEEIRPFLTTEPGLSYNFTQPIAMRVDELTRESCLQPDARTGGSAARLEASSLGRDRRTGAHPGSQGNRAACGLGGRGHAARPPPALGRTAGPDPGRLQTRGDRAPDTHRHPADIPGWPARLLGRHPRILSGTDRPGALSES